MRRGVHGLVMKKKKKEREEPGAWPGWMGCYCPIGGGAGLLPKTHRSALVGQHWGSPRDSYPPPCQVEMRAARPGVQQRDLGGEAGFYTGVWWLVMGVDGTKLRSYLEGERKDEG